MTDLLDYADQLREEIRTGEYHKAHLQHMKREKQASQADVNEVECDIEYLRRELRTVLIRAEAAVFGARIPEANVSVMTNRVRERIREKGAA
jgi:SMC interacting uncharacterized protein involved in chromosome segregation